MKMPDAALRMAPAMLLLLSCLSLPAPAAGLSLAEALDLARQLSPALRARQAGVAGAAAEQPAAASLPDPRLTVGVENLPISGADSFTLAADPGTMQRFALMQEMPNRAKRHARSQLAQARTERQQLEYAVAELQLRREVLRAWVAVYFAARRLALLTDLQRENTLLQQTLPARVAAGQAMAADLTMARQEALAIDDRQDELERDLAKAQAALRRLVGPRGDEPPLGAPPPLEVDPAAVREGLHRHTELAPFDAMQAEARAEIGESEAEAHGDWSWEFVYNRRQRYADMVSFELTFELPLRKSERQDPRIAARRKDLERIEAEREDTARRHAEEVEAQLAELRSLDAQADRLQRRGLPLAAERSGLTLAAYQAGRSELAAVLAARSAEVELRLRALALDAERTDLRVRLNTLIAE